VFVIIMGNKLVILGTAHLESTPGKRSPDGSFREYIYSREICKRIREILLDLGIDCVIDYEDADMYGLNSSQELCERVKIVNKHCAERGAGNCIYVSIHVNAAGCSGWNKATGWCAYTTPGQNNSDKLANKLYDAAHEVLDPLGRKIRADWSDGDPDYESNFYVIKKSNCVSVLTENFFQDCKSDVEWLCSEEGREAIVDIHVRGILRYLGYKVNISE